MRRRTGNIQQRGPNAFRIRYVNNDGIRQSETIVGDREHAERELASRLGDVAKGLPVSSKPHTVLFGELADDVITDYEVNGFRSVDDIEARFRLHIIPVFGRRKASQITTALINKYIVQRQAEGAKPGTINRELEAIKHTFKFALKGRKLLHMPHVPKLRENNVRTGFFTREEVERLTQHLKPPLDSLVWFAFLTGWRSEECRGLLWRNVDFERNEIRLDAGTTKNREGRVYAMTDELRSLLKAITKTKVVLNVRIAKADGAGVNPSGVATVTPYVFPGIGDFRKQWKTACFKAGLPCIIDQKTGKPIKALRTFHDLRRSFAREMDRLGVRQGAIMKLGGWLTDSVFRRYNIVSESDLRDAVETVNRARKRTKRTF